MPEDAEAPAVLLQLLDGLDGAVDAEHLVVFGGHLPQPTPSVLEEQEVLDEIEEACRLAGGAQERVQPDTLRPFLLQPLPRGEDVEGGVRRPHHRLKPVGQDGETIRVEEAGNSVAVVPQVGVVGFLDRLRRRLPLAEEKRDTVDEADGVGPALVEIAGDPGLRGQEEIVGSWIGPVHQPHPVGLVGAIRLAQLYRHAVSQQAVDFSVCCDGQHGGAVLGQLRLGLSERLFGQYRVQSAQRGPETSG